VTNIDRNELTLVQQDHAHRCICESTRDMARHGQGRCREDFVRGHGQSGHDIWASYAIAAKMTWMMSGERRARSIAPTF
jgi:hypothetical protein